MRGRNIWALASTTGVLLILFALLMSLVLDPPIPTVVIAAPAEAPLIVDLQPLAQELNVPAVATAPAVRLDPPQVVLSAPLLPVGLHGLPFAPEGLSDCDEMNFYRVQVGLPELFARLGWRETNCRNEEGVKTFCCYGYWQMYFTQHRADHRMRLRYDACEIFSISDYNGDEPLDKQKQACAAKALYDVAGTSPWAATR